jgi:creatinine amidohydrolase
VTGRPYVLAEVTWPTAREQRYEVAILPWGATEAHNRHLPYATDTLQSEAVAIAAAARAWEKGAKVLVLPSVPFGVQTGQLDIPFCLNMNPSTQAALLGDLVRSLEAHGVAKLVILNGHGGNDFRQMIRELQPDTPMLLCQVNWYACIDARTFFAEPGDHAGELETSMLQHIAPELVRPLAEAGEGKARPAKVRGFREGWAWAPRAWTQVTDDTGVGDPRGATAEKGERFLGAVVDRLSEFLTELAQVDREDLYS